MPQRICIATRESALALWQAEHVAQRLRSLHPEIDVVLVPMTTRGDQLLDRPLASVGGKGLFLKELELAMQSGAADIAVHSMKDVPAALEPGFEVPVVLERASPFDALVSPRYASIAELPRGAIIGTSSLRRQLQLRDLRPDLELRDLRGNVNTRLAKLDAGHYDAIVLACAGLERLGLGSRIRARLEPPAMLPAVAQGAIGIECLAEDERVRALIAPLAHASTAICIGAERAMNQLLQGSCDVPIAGYAQLLPDGIELHGLVGDPTRVTILRAAARSSAADHAAATALGREVGMRLLELGAAPMLKRH
jgi:hydroxymethylbilane synthase